MNPLVARYQVQHRCLKDRKGKVLVNPIHYFLLVTALALKSEFPVADQCHYRASLPNGHKSKD